MNPQNVLKKLFELKVILDRLALTDTSLHEALSLDVEAAGKLADDCIAELSQADEPDEAE